VAATTAADDTPMITTLGEDSAGIVEECDKNNGAHTTNNQLATVNEVEEAEEIAPAFVIKVGPHTDSRI